MTNVQWQLTLIVLTLLLTTGCAIPGSTDPLPLLGITTDPDSAEVVLVRGGEPAATIVIAGSLPLMLSPRYPRLSSGQIFAPNLIFISLPATVLLPTR